MIIQQFILGASADQTPALLNVPLQPGQWALLLGVRYVIDTTAANPSPLLFWTETGIANGLRMFVAGGASPATSSTVEICAMLNAECPPVVGALYNCFALPRFPVQNNFQFEMSFLEIDGGAGNNVVSARVVIGFGTLEELSSL